MAAVEADKSLSPYHAADIQLQYVQFHCGKFGVNKDQTTGQPRGLQGPEITLSDQLVAAWTNFAASGGCRMGSVHSGLWAIPPAGHSQHG
jgi:hypothetical protein